VALYAKPTVPPGKDVGEIFGGGLQVTLPVAETAPIVAVMVAVAFALGPQFTGCGFAADPTDATAGFELVQELREVTSAVDPSAKVPVAV
jgi:hypothetical protein